MPKTGVAFEELVDIMATLRGPDGCPWDKEQTHESLRQYLLEEAYEVLEALDEGDPQSLKEELGDLLLQVLFHAQIASESGQFDIQEVIETISEKLIRRHPNVFGDVSIATAEQQSVNWEKIKKAEGKSSSVDGVPRALSALLRAWRVQQKAATTGFDWKQVAPVWDKVLEEIDELKQACRQADPARIEEEFGDLLFSLVNLSRFIKVNPEDALRKTTDKFVRRFKAVEAHFNGKQQNMSDMTLEELDEVWESVKRGEKSDEAG